MTDFSLTLISKIEIEIGEILEINHITSGFLGKVFHVKSNRGDYVIKHSSGKDINTDFEAAILPFLRDNGVKVPRLISEIKEKGPNNNISITEMFVGTPISSSVNDLALLVDSLYTLHSINCSGWGNINKEQFIKANELVGAQNNFKEFLYIEFQNSSEYLLQQGIISTLQYENLIGKYNDILKKEYKPALCQGDFKPHHIVFDKNTFVGLIDFDNIRIVPEIYDLSILYLYEKDIVLKMLPLYKKLSGEEFATKDLKQTSVVFSTARIAWEHKHNVLSEDYLNEYLDLI